MDEAAGKLIINPRVQINEAELWFTFGTSSGPGGQNVNKVNTRATLHFDLNANSSLAAEQKTRIRGKLPGRISRDGVLRVVSSKHRTQNANRQAATERFVELLAEALHVQKKRKKSGVPAGVKRKRLEDKAHKSKVKQNRRSVGYD